MSDSGNPKSGFSLSRWSRRKLEAARAVEKPVAPAADVVANIGAPVPATNVPGTQDAPGQPSPPVLPAIDSLRFESDFSAFLRPEVDESLRRQALRKLFSDPRFNVMDGLDVYIDDYGKPDPIEPELVRQLVQSRYLFDPPRTRINEQGEVEEVPRETQPGVPAHPAGEADADSASTDPVSSLTASAAPGPAVGTPATAPPGESPDAAALPIPLSTNEPT
jgi:hypothetical protein